MYLYKISADISKKLKYRSPIIQRVYVITCKRSLYKEYTTKKPLDDSDSFIL